jgi:hypothetical protein
MAGEMAQHSETSAQVTKDAFTVFMMRIPNAMTDIAKLA